MTRLGEAERKGIEIKLTGQKKKKKKEDNGEAHETQSWYCLDKCCKTARLRQLANLIDQRRERRNTNGGRERPSEWGTTGGNEASARDNLRFVRVDLGRSQQAQNKLRPSTSWCSCQPCGDSPLSLEHFSLFLFLIPSRCLAESPALLHCSFLFLSLPPGCKSSRLSPVVATEIEVSIPYSLLEASGSSVLSHLLGPRWG